MAFARLASCFSAALNPMIRGGGRKGVNRALFTPREQEISPPPPLPIADPLTGWTRDSKRTGLVGMKMGMSSVFANNMQMLPVTVIHFPETVVTQVKTVERDGYYAVQVGSGVKKVKNVTKPLLGHLQKAGVRGGRKKIAEFRVTPDALVPVGTALNAKHFVPGQFVDIKGTTKGRGFQGVMKRHGFKGLPASHGVSLTHRSLGATGARQDPGKVWKGKRMPGHMGGRTRIARNLVVYRVSSKHNAILVKGAVPGGEGAWVEVVDAARKPHEVAPPFPTYFPRIGEQPEILEATLPPPPEWGDVDWASLDEAMRTVTEPWPADTDQAEQEERAALDPEKLKEIMAHEKLREKKGARGKAIKLEKRLIKEGKLAPKTAAGGAKDAKKKDKKKAE